MKDHNYLTLSQLFFGGACIVILFSSIHPELLSDPQATSFYALMLVCILVLTVLGAQWLARYEPTGFVAWLHPPVLMSAFFLLLYGLPGYASFFDRSLVLSTDTRVGIHYGYTAWGMALILVGLLCLWVGYGFGLHIFRPSKLLASFTRTQISQKAVIQLYSFILLTHLFKIAIVGTSFFHDNSRLGAFESFAQWIGYLENGSYLILAIVAIQVFRKAWPRHLLAIVLAFEITFVIVSGFGGLTILIAAVVMAAAFYNRIRMRKFILHIITFTLVVIGIVPITTSLREIEFNPRSANEIISAVDKAFQSGWGQGVDVALARISGKLFGRQSEAIYAPGIIIQKTPSDIPYQGMEKFLAIPAYIVPRAIWPDKPILSNYIWFSITYFNHPSDTVTSTPMTIFGETYMFGGWLGTSFGLSVLGLLMAFIFRHTVSTGLVGVYFASIPKLLYFEGQYTTLIVELIQGLVVLLFLYWMLVRLSHKETTSSRDVLKQAKNRTASFGVSRYIQGRTSIERRIDS